MAVIEGVQPGERKAMKNAIIKYILSTTAKKLPFKNIDIVKQCLRGEQKWFIHLYPEIEETLSDVSKSVPQSSPVFYICILCDIIQVYGLQIHEVKEKTGKLYLVTSEQHAGSEAEYTAEERVHLRLRLLVLSYIFMKGGQVLEPALFGFLRRLGIEEEPDEYFGEFKKYIGETFVKQLYLKKEKVEMETGHQEERYTKNRNVCFL